jgi:P27 family predicted phage terminase small subunit
VLHGETRPSRLNRHEPEPPSGFPVMPDDLDADAQAEWRHVEREMAATGVIRPVDRMLLRAYCEAVSRYLQSVRMYAASGPLLPDRGHHGVVKNPLHQIVRDDEATLRALARELGLTPSARAGLVAAPSSADPFEAYLRGRRRPGA